MPFMPYVDSQSLVDEDARRKRMYQLQQEPQSIYNQLKNQWFGNDKFAPRAYGDIDLPDNRTRLVPPRPKDPIEYLKNPTAPISKFVNDKLDDYYGPTSNPSGERFSPLTTALGLFSQDFSPEGANPAHGINPGHFAEAATPLVPRELLKKRAKAIADEAEVHFKNYPQLRQVVQDMSMKHPNIVGNLSRITPSKHTNSAAMFWSHDTPNFPWKADALRQIIENPAKTAKDHADPRVRNMAASMLNTTVDERIAKLSNVGPNGIMPRISIGSAQEAQPIASNYSSMRHELSHATDYIYRPNEEGVFINSEHPGYWTSRPEVRARAVERNFGRDMGIKDANKTRAVPFDITQEGEFPALHMDDESLFHELNAARERYGDKIALELATGSKYAGFKSKYGGNRTLLTPAGRARKAAPAREAAIDSYNHFFMPRTSSSGAILKPRLRLPEKFDTHGISQGQYPVPDIMKDLF